VARLDVVIFDELGYPPFTQPGSRLLFYLIVRIYELIMVLLAVNLARREWPSIFGGAKTTAASLLGQWPHCNNVSETDTENWRSKSRARATASKKKLDDALNNEWNVCIFSGRSSAPRRRPIFNPIGGQNSKSTDIRQ
jgi:hypothetical protein